MKKSVWLLAVLMLLPILSQAQSVTGYVDPAFFKTMSGLGAALSTNWDVTDAIVTSGGGGASGTGGGGYYTSAHHWNITLLKQKAEEHSDYHGYIVNIIKDENLDNTYEALVSIGEDPLLTAIALDDEDRKEAILRSFSIEERSWLGVTMKYPVAVVPWKEYSQVSSSGYGYYSYSYSSQYRNRKVTLSSEGAKKAQQILKARERSKKEIIKAFQQNGESSGLLISMEKYRQNK
ncbi:MAG: hypothetical protein IJ311_05770 [Elusimicrobiaceae bacterium]|nr:hypothetical protein [Elusimicrobiaceae bacterium]